jgi:hypothetical protein
VGLPGFIGQMPIVGLQQLLAGKVTATKPCPPIWRVGKCGQTWRPANPAPSVTVGTHCQIDHELAIEREIGPQWVKFAAEPRAVLNFAFDGIDSEDVKELGTLALKHYEAGGVLGRQQMDAGSVLACRH